MLTVKQTFKNGEFRIITMTEQTFQRLHGTKLTNETYEIVGESIDDAPVKVKTTPPESRQYGEKEYRADLALMRTAIKDGDKDVAEQAVKRAISYKNTAYLKGMATKIQKL